MRERRETGKQDFVFVKNSRGNTGKTVPEIFAPRNMMLPRLTVDAIMNGVPETKIIEKISNGALTHAGERTD